jgi:hypothetical protein
MELHIFPKACPNIEQLPSAAVLAQRRSRTAVAGYSAIKAV